MLGKNLLPSKLVKKKGVTYFDPDFCIPASKNLLVSSKLARRNGLVTLPLAFVYQPYKNVLSSKLAKWEELLRPRLVHTNQTINFYFPNLQKERRVTYFAPIFFRSITRIYHLPNLRKGRSYLFCPGLLHINQANIYYFPNL